MWFLIPILGLGGYVAYSRFKQKGGAEGVVQRALVKEAKERANQVARAARQAGHNPKEALKAATLAVLKMGEETRKA